MGKDAAGRDVGSAESGVKAPIRGSGIRNALRRTSANPEFPDMDDVIIAPKAEVLEPGQMPKELIQRCKEAVAAEGAKLPVDASSERMARRRLPRSHSEALLKRGASLKDVATDSALRVLESWIVVLRGFASKEELPHLICAIVHGEPEAESDPEEDEQIEKVSVGSGSHPPSPSGAEVQRAGTPVGTSPTGESMAKQRWRKITGIQNVSQAFKQTLMQRKARRRWPNLKLPQDPDDHPVPPPAHLLGAALRRVVPMPSDLRKRQRRAERMKNQGRPVSPPWEFVYDMLKVHQLKITKRLDASWPENADRRALQQMSGVPARQEFAESYALKLKLEEELSNPIQKSSTPKKQRFRPSESCDSWTSSCEREDPRSVPGPGFYKPHTASLDNIGMRRGQYRSVGRPRTTLGEASLSQSGRFFFRKGDPRYQEM